MAQKIDNEDSNENGDNRDINLDELNVRLRGQQGQGSAWGWGELLFILLWFWAMGLLILYRMIQVVLEDHAVNLPPNVQGASPTAKEAMQETNNDFDQDIALIGGATATDNNNTVQTMETTNTKVSMERSPEQNYTGGSGKMINRTRTAMNEAKRQASSHSLPTPRSPEKEYMSLRKLKRPPDKTKMMMSTKTDQEPKFKCLVVEAKHGQGNTQQIETHQDQHQAGCQTNTRHSGFPESTGGIRSEDYCLGNGPWSRAGESTGSQITEGPHVEAQNDVAMASSSSMNPTATSSSVSPTATNSSPNLITTASTRNEMDAGSTMNLITTSPWMNPTATASSRNEISSINVAPLNLAGTSENHSTIVFCRQCKNVVATNMTHSCIECQVEKKKQ